MTFQRFPIVIVGVLAGTAFAQSGAPVIGSSGYSTPVPLTVAPGQLVTLFVPGFGGVVSASMKAPAGPFPNTLAGVSAVFRQGSDQPSPIVEVQPIKACTAIDPPANSCGSILAVTVQIPFVSSADEWRGLAPKRPRRRARVPNVASRRRGW